MYFLRNSFETYRSLWKQCSINNDRCPFLYSTVARKPTSFPGVCHGAAHRACQTPACPPPPQAHHYCLLLGYLNLLQWGQLENVIEITIISKVTITIPLLKDTFLLSMGSPPSPISPHHHHGVPHLPRPVPPGSDSGASSEHALIFSCHWLVPSETGEVQ